jgi:hypothetical protein
VPPAVPGDEVPQKWDDGFGVAAAAAPFGRSTRMRSVRLSATSPFGAVRMIRRRGLAGRK